MTRRDKHGGEGLGGTKTAPAAPRKRAMRTVTEGAGGAGGRHISNRRIDLSLTHTLCRNHDYLELLGENKIFQCRARHAGLGFGLL